MPWLADLTAAILQRVLGRYVTGLDGRSLKLAVWSGRVVLERLTLRPDALLGLLPVHVRAGFVGRIVMVVPWHKLGSLPVTLDLRDVFVLTSRVAALLAMPSTRTRALRRLASYCKAPPRNP